MKITKISKITYWSSFLGGIPKYFIFRFVPFASINFCAIPSIFILLKSKKVLPIDCFIGILILFYYFFTWLGFGNINLSSTLTVLEFTSVIITFIALRISNFFPSGKGVFYYLIATLLFGFFQLFFYGKGLTGRGIALIASEPSRYARYLAALVLPIFIHWKYLKRKIGLPSLISIFLIIVYLNRSASLIIPFLTIVIALALFSIFYLINLFRSLKINRFLLNSYTTIFLCFIFLFMFFKNFRLVKFLSILTSTVLKRPEKFLDFIQMYGGRRVSTVILSFQNGITSLFPNGVDSAKKFLNLENLSNSFIGLSQYQTDMLSKKESYESSSFFSHYILDCGLLGFLLSLMFTFAVLKLLNTSYFHLIFNKEISAFNKFEVCLRASTCLMGITLLWVFSTNSFIAPWLMIVISLMPYHKKEYIKISD